MKILLTFLAFFVTVATVSAQSADETAIRSNIAEQAASWNRGDIPGFMQVYDDSPDTTFIGASLRKGFEPILERYKQAFSNPKQMGRLTFSDIDIRMLPASCGRTEYALVTGRFHLDRTERSAGTKDEGIFSLVWRKGPHGWKILLDHTS